MSIAPSVSFFNATTNTVIDSGSNPWEAGQIKVGQSSGDDGLSSILHLQVWNNKGGSQTLANMQDVTMYVVDSTPLSIVTNGTCWLQAKCTSLGQSSFTPLTTNYSTSMMIGAAGMSNYQISGVYPTSGLNHADVDLKFVVPDLQAISAGTRNFSVAVKYFYV